MVDINDMAKTLADMKGIPTKDDLKNLLEQNVLVVDFTKLNGDKRVMTCTLREDMKPKATKTDPISQKKVREISDKVIAVWAIESKAFRSFRYDRVKKVEVIPYGNGTEDTANY